MTSLEQLIIEEFEGSSLDFKAIQYRGEKMEDFLVDVISMANAKTRKAKYIVVGVKAYPNGTKNFLGISDDFVDEATYQQIIYENVEPEIKIDYFPISVNGVQLAVFHIDDCDNPPYMLKKNYGKLKKGDAFIRKGTHQTRVTRKDIDDFYRLIKEEQQRIRDIEITAQINGVTTTEINPIRELQFPSDDAAEKIKKILLEKEEKLNQMPSNRLMLDIDLHQIGETPYEKRSTKTLKENLNSVKETYSEQDLYYLFEKRSHKINFKLIHTGSVYLEDASIEIELEKSEGLIVVEKIVNKPDSRSWLDKLHRPFIPQNFENIDYPQITTTETKYKIFDSVGNIKHLIECYAFQTPVRLVLTEDYPINSLSFSIKMFGKTLEKPVTKIIELKVAK